VAANAEVLELLASQITRDVRRLSGAINRLRAAMLTEAAGAELTVDLCQRLLQDLLVVNANSTSLSRIDQVVCEVCGIESAELKSENRGKKVSTARMLAMWLSRRYTNSALSEIGQYFGGRSHSTVIAADKRVSDWIKQREHIQVINASYPVGDMVQRIESKLRIG
jgi:chromosomal replication initiator protein